METEPQEPQDAEVTPEPTPAEAGVPAPTEEEAS